MTAIAPITVALPKGRMFSSLIALLGQAGLIVKEFDRSYRPKASDPRLELKILKPQNIPALVELGRHDLGFTGHDWITETGCRVVTLDDLELEPVDLVAAAAEDWVLPRPGAPPLVVASEYENLSRRFLEQKGWPYRFVRSYGATEVFPPEDADLIVDNSATGQTLKENGLKVVERIMSSSTRFIASEASLKRPEHRSSSHLPLPSRILRRDRRRLRTSAAPRWRENTSVKPASRTGLARCAARRPCVVTAA